MQKLRKTKAKEKTIPSDSKVVFIEALRLKYPKTPKMAPEIASGELEQAL